MDEQQWLCVGSGIISGGGGGFGREELICVRMHGRTHGMCRCGREMCARGVHFDSRFLCCVSHVCVSNERKVKERDSSNEHART